MPSPGVYPFERIDDALPFIPIAARRVLDALGLKLSLEGWLSLTVDDRRRIVTAGSGARVDPCATSVVEAAGLYTAAVLPSLEGSAMLPMPDDYAFSHGRSRRRSP